MLWPFNHYPGTDYETFNWDWLIKTVKTYTAKVDDFIDDITSAWDTFRNYINHEIAEMHRKFAIYVNVTEEALNTGAIANGAITKPKINSDFLREIQNGYVTPEMFGAVGDGVTDDSAAFADALADGLPVLGDPTKTYKTDIVINRSNVIIGCVNMKGTLSWTTSGYNFCKFYNMDIDATGKTYGIYATENIEHLGMYNVHVHDADDINIYYHRAWNSVLLNVSASGAGQRNIELSEFNSSLFVGTAYNSRQEGIRILSAFSATIEATCQENRYQGFIANSMHGSVVRLYLEQNGYEGNDSDTKTQAIIGDDSRCIGNTIDFYANGGADSAMESLYGIVVRYSENNTFAGVADRHLNTGFRTTSLAKNNTYKVFDRNHTEYSYDMASCSPQVKETSFVASNTLLTVDDTNVYRRNFTGVLDGDVKGTLSIENRTSTAILCRVADVDGNNITANVRLTEYWSGIQTA